MSTQPLFDMSKATPIPGAAQPLFDMSKAMPIDQSLLAGQGSGTPAKQPSVWQTLTQPTDKTDKEYLGYTGPAGVAGATVHGLSDVARSTIGTAKGAVKMFDPHTQPGENAFTSLPIVRALRPFVDAAKQIPEIPQAIRDINASPDPTGAYLNAAQDTASQGAGQALTAIGAEALPKALPGAAEIVKRTVPPVVRGVAKGANTVLAKAPGGIGLAAGGALGHLTKIPYAPEIGATIGYGLGQELLPKLKVPGENFGLPKPIYRGAPLPASPPTGEFVDSPPQATNQPRVAPSQVVEPKLLPATASGASRRVPGDIAPEDVSTPDTSTLAGKKGIRIVLPGTPKQLPAATAEATAETPTTTSAAPKPATSSLVSDLLNRGLGNEPPPKPIPGKPIYMRPSPLKSPAPEASPVPEVMTPVQSSGMRAYSYDEPSKTFAAQWPDGSIHKYGEVTPEEVQDFEASDSKGRALLKLKNNHVHVAANYGHGWVNKASAIRSATPELATSAPVPNSPTSDDLTGLLQQSLEAAKSGKGKTVRP
jgi:hypothetical protein